MHLGVEAFGGREHLVGAGRLVACRVERGVDRAVRRGEPARLLDLVVVELAPEQVAQLGRPVAARRSPAACTRLR